MLRQTFSIWPLCGSFRRAAPFVEHLPKQKNLLQSYKKKDQMIFSHMVSFCNTGGLDSSISNDMLEQTKNTRVWR